MTRFTATSLDLSRIDRASVFPALSFEAIREARLADLKARLAAIGIDYNVEMLESDPGVIQQETSAYRELLTRQAIQDAQADVLLAFATGAFLDRLGDLHGTRRAVITPALGSAPAVMEGDDRYRARIQLAPEAFAATGTPGGYIYHAISASADIRDVGLTVIGRGRPDVVIEIVIMSRLGTGEPTPELLDLVRSRLLRDDIKQLTDVIRVRGAVAVPYDVRGKLLIRRGPDPAVIRQAATTSVQAMAERYTRLQSGVPASAIVAALHVAGVDSVVDVLPVGVATQRWQFGRLAAVDLATEVLND